MNSRHSAPLRAVLVTGATGGIGTAVCQNLNLLGLTPLIGHRPLNADAARQIAEECKGISISLDLSDANSIDTAVMTIASTPHFFLGVAHCASPMPKLSPFGQIAEKDMELFWRVNVLGPHRLFAGLIKQRLRKQKTGVVVAVTSQAMGDAGREAMSGMGAYTVSKFGLSGVLALMAAEFSWLRVATVSPSFTQTRMLTAFDPRFIEKVSSQTPLAAPDEIAREIVDHFKGAKDDLAS